MRGSQRAQAVDAMMLDPWLEITEEATGTWRVVELPFAEGETPRLLGVVHKRRNRFLIEGVSTTRRRVPRELSEAVRMLAVAAHDSDRQQCDRQQSDGHRHQDRRHDKHKET
jgi:hypothetical protein